MSKPVKKLSKKALDYINSAKANKLVGGGKKVNDDK